jgi:hypothetical protein
MQQCLCGPFVSVEVLMKAVPPVTGTGAPSAVVSR